MSVYSTLDTRHFVVYSTLDTLLSVCFTICCPSALLFVVRLLNGLLNGLYGLLNGLYGLLNGLLYCLSNI